MGVVSADRVLSPAFSLRILSSRTRVCIENHGQLGWMDVVYVWMNGEGGREEEKEEGMG
jgi:hypothetical protein